MAAPFLRDLAEAGHIVVTLLNWWRENWQAEPTKAEPTTAKLIPIVTTAPHIDAVELAQKLQAQGVPPGQWKTERNKLQAEAERDMQALWERVSRVLETSNKEFAKWERYCREQGELLRALEDLAVQERTMYELDNRKDQIMTECSLALANLAMWTRDQCFPTTFARTSL
jgi:hypothetical protein